MPGDTETNTAIPTDTPVETATSAPTETNTPRPGATNTTVPTSTNTTVPSATNTSQPPPTNTATNTPPPGTATATNTPTPGGQCVPPGQKVSIIIGIVLRMGVKAGEPLFQTRYDLNATGSIDVGDLALALNLVPCHPVRAQAPTIIMTARAST